MFKSGYKNRLLLMLGLAALMTLTIALIGWLSFRQVVTSQRAIIDDAIPSMDSVQSLARINSKMIGDVSRLETLNSIKELASVESILASRMQQMLDLLEQLDKQGFEPDITIEIARTASNIHNILRQQVNRTRKRLSLQQRQSELFQSSLTSANHLIELSESLVANASASATANITSLYLIIEQNNQERSHYTLDRLIETDIDRMERMSELQLVCFRISALLEQLDSLTDSSQVPTIEQELGRFLQILARRLSDIEDPQWTSTGTENYNNITQNIERGLFARYTERLDLDSDFVVTATQTGVLVGQLNDLASALLTSASQSIDIAGNNARNAVKSGVIGFAIVAVLMLIALAVTVWAQLQYHFISRLNNMESVIRQIAAGNYAVPIPDTGDDEMSRVSTALQEFRENAVERQNLQEKLQQQQRDLENLVDQRTGELQKSNSLLAQEVVEHTQARNAAEKANAAKTNFLATMSHELRTPLSGVLGTLQLLADTGLSNEQQQYAKMIRTANTTLLEILEDMLGYSQIDAGKLSHEQCRFSLRDTIDNILSIQMVRIDSKALSLVREVAKTVPDNLSGDRRKLNQILLNLVGNAIKFTDEGSVTVVVEEKSKNNRKYSSLTFSIIDTGIGIPATKCAEVFEPFVQVRDAENRHHGGTGLGLAICKRLVENMGGSISIESQLNIGTCVSFTLDFLVLEPEKHLADSVKTNKTQSTLRKLNVLIVEDDAVNLMVSTRYLEYLGHKVLQARDGNDALSILQRPTTEVNIILMDISLPGASGVDVALEIRKLVHSKWENTPIIAMSAHVFGDEIDNYFAAGMIDFLAKPFSRSQLSQALESAIADGSTFSDRPTHSKKAVIHGELIDKRFVDEELETLGRETLKELLMLFEQDYAPMLDELMQDHTQKNWLQLRQKIHKLKSASSNLGMSLLTEKLQLIEDAANGAEVSISTLTEVRVLFQQSCDAVGLRLA